MKKNLAITFCLLLVSTFISSVYAAEESPINQFLGSPLLILTAIIVIDIIAFLYRKIRK
ncbi:MAG: hypothetical protein QHH12_02750 [Candidatus Bathyarchaeota archaeon]|nr:hypothetical protein [Candidatus Bathyarchaeota archaeon A05DMB-3]MDH7606675.1 hypothetical protein [Candidatus Bathyarchaeota archaeon]